MIEKEKLALLQENNVNEEVRLKILAEVAIREIETFMRQNKFIGEDGRKIVEIAEEGVCEFVRKEVPEKVNQRMPGFQDEWELSFHIKWDTESRRFVPRYSSDTLVKTRRKFKLKWNPEDLTIDEGFLRRSISAYDEQIIRRTGRDTVVSISGHPIRGVPHDTNDDERTTFVAGASNTGRTLHDAVDMDTRRRIDEAISEYGRNPLEDRTGRTAIDPGHGSDTPGLSSFGRIYASSIQAATLNAINASSSLSPFQAEGDGEDEE